MPRRVLPTGLPPNTERAAEEAGRRARAKIRRYAAANRLNRLGTLTYRGVGCHDPLRLRGDLAGFFRELRDGLATGRFPYVWVPQWPSASTRATAEFACFLSLSEAHVSAMAHQGRRPRWSRAQRDRVLALAAEGASQRAIAEAVFGEARYRGRVERILRADAAASNGASVPRNSDREEAPKEALTPESDLELFRELVSRSERAMLESDHPPSLLDIDRLLKIKRQLEALETIESMRALTRERS
ncbi:MAG: hypothetical protein M3364_08285 [Actinomycetota bacterium]|nr:hypothetical protein [Actinomycetota bacterium]